MKLERLYHSAVMLALRTRTRRTKYLKKHNILGGIGEGCEWVPWLIPLYPKMIKLHNNVHIHKTAKLIPHDVLNGFLKKVRPDEDFGSYERIGCIEIMDNVYVAMNAVILPDVRIGENCIITAGSVVSSDIPLNSIVAGNPAKVVGDFDSYVASRKMLKGQSVSFTNQLLPDEIVEQQWERFEKKREEKKQRAEKKQTTVEKAHVSMDLNDGTLEDKLLSLLTSEFPEVDFLNEEHLIEDEVLDSLQIISIMALIEKSFGVKIPRNLMDEEHFDSVHLMAETIKEHMGK